MNLKILKILLLFLIFISVIGYVDGDDKFIYRNNRFPTFSINDQPLIQNFNASYVLNEKERESNFLNISDENIFLAYSIAGIKYLGANVSTGKLCPDLRFFVSQVGAPYSMVSMCIDPTTSNKTGSWPTPSMPIYSTTIPDIDAYQNNPSFEGEILVHYNLSNKKIAKVAPIIFNLGKLPIRVNDDKINDVLSIPIENDTIIVYGSNLSLVLNKGANNSIAVAYQIGLKNWTDPPMVTYPRSNPNFSYVFYKIDDDYFLKVQNKSPVDEGVLALNFRSIKIDYTIKIEDPIVENALSFTEPHDILRYKPKFQVIINNCKIRQLEFQYSNKGNNTHQNVSLNENGSYFFNEYIDANGNSFYYPFDHFSSTIFVNPPLLIANQKDISTQINSGFDSSIEVYNKNIIINFSRSSDTILLFLISLIIALIATIAYYLKNEKSNYDFIVVVIGPFLVLLISNGLAHIWSIGTLLIIIPFFIIWVHFRKIRQVNNVVLDKKLPERKMPAGKNPRKINKKTGKNKK